MPSSGASSGETEDSGEIEPTNEELENLFSSAMREINGLDTEDPCDYIKHIFDDVEVYSEDCVTINQLPYARTSPDYSKLVEYYANIFTDESLDWILSTKFANVEGKVYCCVVGGQTGKNIQVLSIEKLQENTYKSTFLIRYGANEEEEASTEFEIKNTDAGCRISDIDYRIS